MIYPEEREGIILDGDKTGSSLRSAALGPEHVQQCARRQPLSVAMIERGWNNMPARIPPNFRRVITVVSGGNVIEW